MTPGGAERIVIDLSLELIARGHEVTILHFGNPWINDAAEEHQIPVVIVAHHRLYKSKYTLPVFLWYFKGLICRLGASVIHSHLLGAVVAGGIAGRLAHTPSVGTLHDSYSVVESRAGAILAYLAALFSTRIVTVCDDMKSKICDVAKVKVDSIVRVHNGAKLERFLKRHPQNENQIGKAVVIGSVARFVRLKQLDHLLTAASRLRTRNEWELWLIGDGPVEQELRELAVNLGIDAHVQFLGFRDNIPNILGSLDIFSLCSNTEGLSMSLIESMAASLPAVASDVGGNSELILEGETGLLYPNASIESLTDALTKLIDDHKYRFDMGAAARIRAVEKFGVDTMTDQYEFIYRDVVGPEFLQGKMA